MNEKEDLERRLSELLEDGEMEQADQQAKRFVKFPPSMRSAFRLHLTL